MAEKDNNEITEEVVMESSDSQILETGFAAQQAEEAQQQTQAARNTARHEKKQSRSLDPLLLQAIAAILVGILLIILTLGEMDNIDQQVQQRLQQQAEENLAKVHLVAGKRVENWQKKLLQQTFPKMQDEQLLPFDDFFPGAKLLYLQQPLDHKAITEHPARGYALLATLDEVRLQPAGFVSNIELLKPGTEHEAIILVSGDFGSDQRLKGYYITLLPKDFAKAFVQNLQLHGGYIAIKQGSQSGVYLYRDTQIPPQYKEAAQRIAHSQWLLEYYLPIPDSTFVASDYWLVAIYLMLILLSLGFLVFTLLQWNKKRLLLKQQKQQQQQTLLTSTDNIQNLAKDKQQPVQDLKLAAQADTETTTDKKQVMDDTIDEQLVNDYGFRGIASEQLNPAVVAKIAFAVAQEIENAIDSKISIGHDNRLSSASLYQGLLQGLQYCDLEVSDLGMVTLPVLYQHAIEHSEGNAILISAGSSEAQYNGIKILLHGELYTRKLYQTFNKIRIKNDPDLKSRFQKTNFNQQYIQAMAQRFKLARKLKIVVDCANTVSATVIIDLLKALGCEVIPVFDQLDGNFPSHSPNPVKPENYMTLVEKVKTEAADMGFLYNSDGSACGFVNSAGEIIWADKVTQLFAQHMLQQQGSGKILYDVKSSASMVDVINRLNGDSEITPSGCTLIKQRMDINKAILAGEFSGHIYHADHLSGLDDAFYNTCYLLQILSQFNGTSHELFKALPEKLNTPEIRIAVQPGELQGIMEKLMEQKNEFLPAAIVTIDGIRAEYEDGWGMVRASQTECCLCLRFEADNPQALQRIAEKFKEVILSVVFVKFPF